VEAALRKADATLGRVLAKARTGGASALSQQIKGLQAGLKKLSAGLEQMETKKATTGPAKRAERPAAAPKPARARKPKKAA